MGSKLKCRTGKLICHALCCHLNEGWQNWLWNNWKMMRKDWSAKKSNSFDHPIMCQKESQGRFVQWWQIPRRWVRILCWDTDIKITMRTCQCRVQPPDVNFYDPRNAHENFHIWMKKPLTSVCGMLVGVIAQNLSTFSARTHCRFWLSSLRGFVWDPDTDKGVLWVLTWILSIHNFVHSQEKSVDTWGMLSSLPQSAHHKEKWSSACPVPGWCANKAVSGSGSHQNWWT